MSKKSTSSSSNSNSKRPSTMSSSNPPDAPISGLRDNNSEIGRGSSQAGTPTSTSAIGVPSTSIFGQGAGAIVTKSQLDKAKAAMRGAVAATRNRTPKIHYQTEGSLVEVLQPELSEYDKWRPLAGWFAVKPHQATLPTLGFAKLRDKAVRWDRGYHMVKTKPFVSWMHAHHVFRVPDIPDNHIEIRDDELMRMFPDIGCQ